MAIPEALYRAALPTYRHQHRRELRVYTGDPGPEDVRIVCHVLGLSDGQAARVCHPTMAARRVREWKTGRRAIPPHHFASLAYCAGNPELRRWLMARAGLLWWMDRWEVEVSDDGTRRRIRHLT